MYRLYVYPVFLGPRRVYHFLQTCAPKPVTKIFEMFSEVSITCYLLILHKHGHYVYWLFHIHMYHVGSYISKYVRSTCTYSQSTNQKPAANSETKILPSYMLLLAHIYLYIYATDNKSQNRTRKLSSTEDRDLTDRVSKWNPNLDLDLQSNESSRYDPYTCKRSVSGHSVQKLRVVTDRQTEAIALPPVLTRSVKLAFHGADTNTDFLARWENDFRKSRVSDVSARILARMYVSVSASWNSSLKTLCSRTLPREHDCGGGRRRRRLEQFPRSILETLLVNHTPASDWSLTDFKLFSRSKSSTETSAV